jgi:hypothetical protein
MSGTITFQNSDLSSWITFSIVRFLCVCVLWLEVVSLKRSGQTGSFSGIALDWYSTGDCFESELDRGRSRFSQVRTDKYQDSISIRQRTLVCRFFPIGNSNAM